MRLLSLLLLLLMSVAGFAQTLGKTDAQILAMGKTKWLDYYAEKEGTSTADMCDANASYGAALKRRNDRLIAENLDGDWVSKLRKLRKLLTSFGTSAIDLSYNRAGGGTMWNIFYSAIDTDVEEVVYGLLEQKGAKPKALVVSTVTKALDRLASENQILARDKTASYFKAAEARKSVAEMRTQFQQILVIAKTTSRNDSDRILGFCRRYAVIPLDN